MLATKGESGKWLDVGRLQSPGGRVSSVTLMCIWKVFQGGF